ncbi:unnamed protein product, partial [Polarella glacialis]
VRTLAFSARQSALAAGETLRPLVVITSLEVLPAAARRTLQALERTGLISLHALPPPPPGMMPILWSKLQLWRLPVSGPLLYLDADTLVVGSLGPLLRRAASMSRFVFGASVTRSMSQMNMGVMLVRPDERVFQSMLDVYASRSAWTGVSRWSGRPWEESQHTKSQTTAGASESVSGEALEAERVSGVWRTDMEENDFLNEFVAMTSSFGGELLEEDPPGKSSLCDAELPWLHRFQEILAKTPGSLAEGMESSVQDVFCTLPTAYNFCATGPCLQRLAQEEESSPIFQAYVTALRGVKVLHWPGSLRKPWQKCSPAARSSLDEQWWQ